MVEPHCALPSRGKRLGQRVSTRWFCLPGDISRRLETFWILTRGECHWPLVGGGQTPAWERVITGAVAVRGGGSWFSRTRLVPLESRGRPSTTGTGSGSLFPPLDSSGPQAAFSSEPTPGTSPGVPTGAQQAGEVAHPAVLACRPHGTRSCGQTFGINRSLCPLFLQCLCVSPCAGQSSPRRMPCF